MIKSFEPPEAFYTDYSVRGGFGHNQLKSWCFEVQPAAGCDLPICLHIIQVYSPDSSKMTRNFPEVLNQEGFFNPSMEML